MSDVKRLLDEATPLPWRECLHLTDKNRCTCGFFGEISSIPADVMVAQMGPCQFVHRHEEGCGGDMVPVAPEPARKANGQLIVYAVNRLPDYEAAVDALERLVRLHDAAPAALDVEFRGALTVADAALARLREPVPA